MNEGAEQAKSELDLSDWPESPGEEAEDEEQLMAELKAEEDRNVHLRQQEKNNQISQTLALRTTRVQAMIPFRAARKPVSLRMTSRKSNEVSAENSSQENQPMCFLELSTRSCGRKVNLVRITSARTCSMTIFPWKSSWRVTAPFYF